MSSCNQCHGSALPLYEMHPSLNIMKHFSTFPSLSIKGSTFVTTQWDHNDTTTHVLMSRILGNRKKRKGILIQQNVTEHISKGRKEQTCCSNPETRKH